MVLLEELDKCVCREQSLNNFNEENEVAFVDDELRRVHVDMGKNLKVCYSTSICVWRK